MHAVRAIVRTTLVTVVMLTALAALAALVAGCGGAGEGAEPQPPEMPVLLHQAWERSVAELGADAAQERFAAIDERNQALRSALRTRDLQQVRGAQEALRAEQVRVIATALRGDGARQVLDAVAAMIADLRERADQAEAEGRDAARLRTAIDEAATAHERGIEALRDDEHELALRSALHAVDVITGARVMARGM